MVDYQMSLGNLLTFNQPKIFRKSPGTINLDQSVQITDRVDQFENPRR